MNNNPFDKTIKAPLWAVTLLLSFPVIGIFVYQANMSNTDNEVVIETPRSQMVENNTNKTEPVKQDPIITEEVKPPVVTEIPEKEVSVVEEVKYSKDKSEYTKVEKTVVPTPPSEINEYIVYAVENVEEGVFLYAKNNDLGMTTLEDNVFSEYNIKLLKGAPFGGNFSDNITKLSENKENKYKLTPLINLDNSSLDKDKMPIIREKVFSANKIKNNIYFTVLEYSEKYEGNIVTLYKYYNNILVKYEGLSNFKYIDDISLNENFIILSKELGANDAVEKPSGIIMNLNTGEYRSISDKQWNEAIFISDNIFKYQPVIGKRECTAEEKKSPLPYNCTQVLSNTIEESF